MEKFTQIRAKVMPLPLRDVDTDMIIPAQYLTSTSKDGYGKNLFRRLSETDQNFPLNKNQYADAQIIVADDNFGCGSSREHAVWALLGRGFKVVISTSFADIFAGNASKNGLVLVTLEEKIILEILEAAKSGYYYLTVDLGSQRVTLPSGSEVLFEFDAFRKHCILNGLDDLDYLIEKKDKISAYFSQNSVHRFFSTETPNN